MLKKKMMSLGIAVIFTLSSLTTTVFAADFTKAAAGSTVTVKFTNPGKGNGKGNDKDEKKFKFNDSQDVTWALNAIEKLAGKGILGGVGQGKFAPRNNVTHLEALAMVMRLTGDDKLAESQINNKVHPKYDGVKPVWGLGYIFVAIEKGILLPEELKGFNPNVPAKRHEIAKYIIRAMGKTDEALKYMDEDLSFKDSSAVPEKSVGYVYLVNELKIMSGNNNMFKPMEPVTRAEMAVLLDRADGKITLPDTDTKKNGTVFVSADVNDNEITVKVKGTTVTYDVLEDVHVYKDGAFETIEDLVAGDVLQLIFNDKKEIIFIDVVKDAEDNTVEETELSVASVDYEDLSEVLQDKVDDLKSTKNYKAYEYNDYIYLLATMGRKSTGGYDIDFEEVYKVENDDDFVVKAVIDTDEPSSNDSVTQAVTYPYSVVKFKSFDDIDSVRFVDKDEDKLAEVEIVNVDETSIVEGEIYDIISSSKIIKVEKSNGTKVSYTVPTSAEIIVNSDDDAEFSDLEEGMSVEVEIADDKVIKVTATDGEEDELSVEAVDYSDLADKLKDQVDYLKLSKNYKAYEYDEYIYLIATMGKKTSSGYEIVVDNVYKIESGSDYTIKAIIETDTSSANDGTTSYPYSIVKFKEFDNIESVRFVDEDNNKLAEVDVVELDEVVKVEGTINSIIASSRTIKVEKSNGSVVTLTIPTDAEITVNDDENESFSDLVKGMNITVEIADERVTTVTAEDKTTEVTGILTGISISTEKKITLKVGSTSRTYTVASDVKVVIDEETARVEDLRVNNELTLKFTNGLLVEIEK
ncbi:MAG TPA: S-layer homology domain-containing protein [Clostridia bacterium]|nr:S-layer homology domain-containing protein [Clostridia bacterium]